MKYLKLNLSLFGEGASGEGGSDGAEQGTSPAAETPEMAAAEPEVKEKTPEELRKEWDAHIKSDYKDFFTQDTQKIIDKRFKETKNLEAKNKEQSEILDTLYSKYKVTDNASLKAAIESDDSMWQDAADDAGMTVEQYKTFSKLQRDNKRFLEDQKRRDDEARINAQVDAWTREAEKVRVKYPSFDLKTEIENPTFLSMLQSGVQMSAAYEVAHLDEIVHATQTATQKAVTENIRAKGTRVSENGTSVQSAFTIKNDPSKFSKKDFEDIKKRVARGEIIRFN